MRLSFTSVTLLAAIVVQPVLADESAKVYYTVDSGIEGTPLVGIRSLTLDSTGVTPFGTTPVSVVADTPGKILDFDVAPDHSTLAYCQGNVSIVTNPGSGAKTQVAVDKVDAIGIALVSPNRFYVLLRIQGAPGNTPSYDVWCYEQQNGMWQKGAKAIAHFNPSSHLTVSIAALSTDSSDADTVFIVVNNGIQRIMAKGMATVATNEHFYDGLHDLGRPRLVANTLIVPAWGSLNPPQPTIATWDANVAAGRPPDTTIEIPNQDGGLAVEAGILGNWVYFTTGASDFLYRCQIAPVMGPVAGRFAGAASCGNGYPSLMTIKPPPRK